ncbi:MAG: hypothetical protein U0744_16825 [Gemmataceae bacterium]
MWTLPLGKDQNLLLAPVWPGWSFAGQGAILAGSFIGLVLLFVWLARWDRLVATPVHARWLLGVRLLIGTIAWSLASLQPTLVVERDNEAPSRVLIALDRSSSMDIADPQRSPTEAEVLEKALRMEPGNTHRLCRREIVHRILSDEGADLESVIAQSHALESIVFRERAEHFAAKPTAALTRDVETLIDGTDLSRAMQACLARSDSAGGKVIGVVLFSDGQHHGHGDPLAQARELARRNVPIFAVPIGSKTPPADIAVIDLKAPQQVAKGAETVVEAKVSLRGIVAGKLTLRWDAHGVSKDLPLEKVLDHDGKDTTLTFPIPLKFEEFGVHRVQLTVSPPERTMEISEQNNRLSTVIRVASEKVRVLLVDADVRWEHHYLATALQRDPDVSLDRVVFHAGRLGITPEERLESLGFAKRSLPKLQPEREDPLWAYDVIVLGDISPEDLPMADRRRIEAFVGERGGTLVLHAGKRWQPRGFSATHDDPLAKLVPIETANEVRPKDGFRIRLTDAGEAASFLRLADDEAEHRKTWAELPRHFWALTGTPKAGAVALGVVEIEGAKASAALATIVQSNYGFGKVIFFGIDSTWRWRYRVGDRHHHRLWGQLVRSVGADPWTPGASRLVRYGAVSPVVRPGEDAEAVVRIAESLAPPVGPVRIKVLRLGEQNKESMVGAFEIPNDGKRSRIWQGKLKGLPAGSYRLEPDMPVWKEHIAKEESLERRDLFTVLPPETSENADLATNYALLSAIAEASGGRVVEIEEIDRLPSLLRKLVATKHERMESRPWHDAPWTWYLFSLLLGLLTLEWTGRKWAGLP